jgi:hypothetical protein
MADKTDQDSKIARSGAQAMAEAIALLRTERITFRRPDKWTLKFGAWNYWPATQRLYRDGDETSLRNQGLPEIKSLIDSSRRATRPRTAVRPPDHSTTGQPLTLQFIEE